MLTQFRLPRFTASRLRELSVSPEAVVRQAGLSPELLSGEKSFLTIQQLFAFWRAVGAVSQDPTIGLAMGVALASEDRVERLDLVALATLSCPSWREALIHSARYEQLYCASNIHLGAAGADCAVRFSSLPGLELGPDVLTDLCVAWLTTLAARSTGGAVRPISVRLKRGLLHRRLYEARFQCRVRFSSPENVLVFRAEDLDRPLVTHNAELLAVLTPRLDAELADRQGRIDIREQVKRALRRSLGRGGPGLPEIARVLGSSSRTLQRLLRQVGVSYQQVLEEARREMAAHYLEASSMKLVQIAALLGYKDSNSFFRAFHRWEGVSPGQWRTEHGLQRETTGSRKSGIDVQE